MHFIQRMYEIYHQSIDKWNMDDFCNLLHFYRLYPVKREFAAILGKDHSNLFKKLDLLSSSLFERVAELNSAHLLEVENRLCLNGDVVIGSVDTLPIYVRRPSRNQHIHFSGKYKKHVVKIQAFSDNLSNVFHYTGPHLGSIHDMRIYRKNIRIIPVGAFVLGDKAYVCRDSRSLQILTPFKRNSSITEEQLRYNETLKPIRIRVEHAFGFLKRFNILSGVYRGRLFYHDDTPTELEKAIRIILHLILLL